MKGWTKTIQATASRFRLIGDDGENHVRILSFFAMIFHQSCNLGFQPKRQEMYWLERRRIAPNVCWLPFVSLKIAQTNTHGFVNRRNFYAPRNFAIVRLQYPLLYPLLFFRFFRIELAELPMRDVSIFPPINMFDRNISHFVVLCVFCF